jgi:hypothetical protein
MASQELKIPRGNLLLFTLELLQEAPRSRWDVSPALGSPGLDPCRRLFASRLGGGPLEEGRAGDILMLYIST